MVRSARTRRPDAKIEGICAGLQELALQKGPHARLPTVLELCETLGTSRATLDEALKVLEAQNIIYRKQGSGIFVSPKLARKTICMLFDTGIYFRSSLFWSELLGFCVEMAQKRAASRDEYYLVHHVVHMPDQELSIPEEVVTMIQERRIHGVIFVHIDQPAVAWVIQQGVPAVCFACFGPWMVHFDQPSLVRLGVDSLVEQGCRKIALWSGLSYSLEDLQNPLLKRDATLQLIADMSFPDLLARHGLPFSMDQVRLIPQLPARRRVVSGLQHQAYMLTREIFSGPLIFRPDGIVINHDVLTEGVLAALFSLGLQIGTDVKIATHANAGTSLLWNDLPGMTMIEYDPAELAQTLFSTLDLLLANQQPTQQVTLIYPRLRDLSTTWTS